MSALSIRVQIKSLEAQIRVLKAQLARNTEDERPQCRFAELYGMLAGKSNFTEEDIRSSEYKFEWDRDTEGR